MTSLTDHLDCSGEVLPVNEVRVGDKGAQYASGDAVPTYGPRGTRVARMGSVPSLRFKCRAKLAIKNVVRSQISIATPADTSSEVFNILVSKE